MKAKKTKQRKIYIFTICKENDKYEDLAIDDFSSKNAVKKIMKYLEKKNHIGFRLEGVHVLMSRN